MYMNNTPICALIGKAYWHFRQIIVLAVLPSFFTSYLSFILLSFFAFLLPEFLSNFLPFYFPYCLSSVHHSFLPSVSSSIGSSFHALSIVKRFVLQFFNPSFLLFPILIFFSSMPCTMYIVQLKSSNCMSYWVCSQLLLSTKKKTNYTEDNYLRCVTSINK